tara:strand:- start:428 stop:1258 length:831 start_codon:yes stop_codon:yes gene_type:complete
MKKLLYLLLLTPIIYLTSCSDKEKEAELEAEIIELSIQLDECENGSDKLLAAIEIADKKKNNTEVKLLFEEIENRHPESKEYTLARKIYDKIIAEEKAKKDKLLREIKLKEKEEKKKNELAKKERLKSLNKLKKNFDDVSGITWYKQPYFTHYSNTNLTSIYMGEKGSSKWLILTMSYTGDDWIFFDNAILSYDGNSKTISFDKYKEKETDNSGGSVWEWIDVSVDNGLESFLREFAKSKNAKMRFSGKYTKTRTLTYNERRGIVDVLNGYDALNE